MTLSHAKIYKYLKATFCKHLWPNETTATVTEFSNMLQLSKIPKIPCFSHLDYSSLKTQFSYFISAAKINATVMLSKQV